MPIVDEDEDLADFLARTASRVPPADLAKRIAASNAGMPSFAPPMGGPAPRFTDRRLNAGGYTMAEGPYKGQVVIANPANLPRENILGHEAHHARAIDTPMPDTPLMFGGYGSPNVLGNMERTPLAERMSQMQPPADVAGPFWGLSPNRSAEEQIANIRGYEAQLPRGTSIQDTDVGRQILPTQSSRDYYYTQSSIPHGGIWEGQSQPQGTTMDMIANLLRNLLVRGGLNTVNR